MWDWRELDSDGAIERFVDLFEEFHDGCIKEVFGWGGHFVDTDGSAAIEPWVNVRVLFQKQGGNPTAVEMVFEEMFELVWKPAPRGYDDQIFTAWVYRRDGLIVWSDEPPGEVAGRLIAARRVWWRDASEWMGEELRLGPRWDPRQPG